MIVDCVSDLHGHFPYLEGGDLLIVAGDLTASDRVPQYKKFFDWFTAQKYRKKILIGGNHDNFLRDCIATEHAREMGLHEPEGFEYLFDSGCEFEGIKIWGSPWTKAFEGQNPHCAAFSLDTDEELAEKWALIPRDTDILVTHIPPARILDMECRKRARCGSQSLRETVNAIAPKIHVFGHIHESYGKIRLPRILDEIEDPPRFTCFINASHVDRDYNPVNSPIRVEI